MKKLTVLTTILALCFQSSTLEAGNAAYAYELQRMELEKHLSQKIKAGLAPVVAENHYILNVGVKLKPLPPAKPRVIRKSKTLPRPVQSADGTTIDDLVPLPKVGFWPARELAGQEEIIEPAQNIIKFDELVESVLIDILVDETRVTPEQQVSVEEVVKLIARKSSPVDPFVVVKQSKVAFEDLQKKDLVTSVSEEVSQRFKNETEKYLEQTRKQSSDVIFQLSGPITYFVIALLLFTIMMVLSKRFLHLQEKRLDLDEMISRQKIEAMLKSKEKESGGSDMAKTMVGISGPQAVSDERFLSGVDQLKDVAKKDPSAVSFMVKKWLHSSDRMAEQALYVATRCLSADTLDQVRQRLTDTDMKDWNSIIYKMPLYDDISKVDTFIAHSISSEAVFPIAIADLEVKELIQSITPAEAANCIERNHSLAKLFSHYMPTLKLARIMQHMGDSAIMEFARNTSPPSGQDIQMLGAKLKEVLSTVRSESNRNNTVFYHIAPDLVREVGLDKEGAIFKSLAQMGNIERLVEIAEGYLPADLVTDLPGDILGSAMQEMTLGQRAELIYSQDADRKKLLTDLFGTGRSREILEQELETIGMDHSKSKMLKRSSAKLWSEFVLQVRSLVQNNRDLSDEIQPLIREWAQTQVRSAKGGGGASAA